jgi:molecular chaperone GrpE
MDKTQKTPVTAKTEQPKLQHDGDEVKKRYEELEKKLAEMTNDRLRALADFQNLQKRTREEQERFAKLSNAAIITELLMPFDHLKMAAEHTKDQGIAMVVRQFQQIFEQEGVKEIDALGKKFDPKTMDAVEAVDGEKDIVMKVREPGYTLFDYVLKPARVEVGNGKQ